MPPARARCCRPTQPPTHTSLPRCRRPALKDADKYFTPASSAPGSVADPADYAAGARGRLDAGGRAVADGARAAGDAVVEGAETTAAKVKKAFSFGRK